MLYRNRKVRTSEPPFAFSMIPTGWVKTIWKQKFIATAPTGSVKNTSRSHQALRLRRISHRGWRVEVLKLKLGRFWKEPHRVTESASGSPSQRVSLFKTVLCCYDGGSGHLCAQAVAMLCESEVTASTFRHLSAFSCPETIEGGPGSFAPTLFNLIVKYKRPSPHIESYFGPSAHSHLSPLN